jgi:hydrophobic/amphiphilic exporter-1 (mainly G- bacteria), HAE1 family
VIYIYLDRIDRRLKRRLEPQLEQGAEGERPHVVAAE